MKKLFIAIMLIYVSTNVLSSQNLSTDKAGTNISFKIKNLGIYVDGVFSEFQIKANFDFNNLENSYFRGTAAIQSVDTGIEARNKSLQKEAYFNSAQFPEMKLSSDKIKKLKDGQYEFVGKLSIKGKTKVITFPFTLDTLDNYLIAKGTFEINRLDFDVGESSWILNKKVKVSIVYKGNRNDSE